MRRILIHHFWIKDRWNHWQDMWVVFRSWEPARKQNFSSIVAIKQVHPTTRTRLETDFPPELPDNNSAQPIPWFQPRALSKEPMLDFWFTELWTNSFKARFVMVFYAAMETNIEEFSPSEASTVKGAGGTMPGTWGDIVPWTGNMGRNRGNLKSPKSKSKIHLWNYDCYPE